MFNIKWTRLHSLVENKLECGICQTNVELVFQSKGDRVLYAKQIDHQLNSNFINKGGKYLQSTYCERMIIYIKWCQEPSFLATV